MAIYDILVIFCLGFFGVVGWIRGLSWQLMGVLTIVLGFTMAYPLSAWLEPVAADMLGMNLSNSESAQMSSGDLSAVHFLTRGAAWTGSFALIWLFTHLLYYLFREGIERWHMEELNRTLGGVFGALKGALVVCAMTLIVVTLGVERTRTPDPSKVHVRVPPFLDHSAVAPTVTKVLRLMRFAVPEDFGYGFTEYLDALPQLDDETRAATVNDPRAAERDSAPAGGEGGDGKQKKTKTPKKTPKTTPKKTDTPKSATGDAASGDDAKKDAAAGDDSSGDGDQSSSEDDGE